ncbi:DNA topoisomerase IV [Leeuwenhoekiella marinoflava]|uniref:DNA topoisomerase IV n=2 Tax=Leeuwenhoekiella marinoflava TaxID=988 RepID=A0A4V1KR93_9FLAO|nr:DNA topoisomerase IV [Leeuwenhoekiella marinoflava]RXG24112.1 hypothetical protein DSL99_3754 [Leeuwenhoekiella marinoflava]SHF98035.1 hypothetical protein SAMN02745246_03893 [Leeuwenhoekiella marinoflava DSM 3653]
MMLKKFILVLVTSFILVGCYNQEKNCTDFKTGTFTFETYLNGEVVKTTFTRNDTLEIDFYQGQVDSSNIRWINDCEYIAEKINPTGIMDRKALHFKILTTKDNTYTFEYALVGETKKQKGTVTKIE